MWKQRFISWIINHRKLVVLLTLIPTVAGGAVAGRVGFDAKIENFFLDDDPALVDYNAFLERFKADQIAVIGLFADDVFDPRVLAKIDAITHEVDDMPHVHRARSLINARVFRSEDEDIKIAPMMRSLPKTTTEARALRKWALDNSLLRETYISLDGKAAAIVVEIDRHGLSQEQLNAQVGALWKIVDRESRGGLKLRLAGKPVVAEGFERNIQTDIKFNSPMVILLLTVIIFVIFRRITSTLIPLAVVVMSICWMFGLMYLFKIKLTTVSPVLNGLVLVVGVADTIHVLSEYYWRLAGGQEHEEAITNTVSHLLIPCLLTSLTTIVGLLSLLTSDLAPIREFAVFSSVGVASAFILSITLVPALLRMTRPPKDSFLRKQREGLINRLLSRISRPSRTRRLTYIGVTVGLLALCGLAIPKVGVGANMIRFFKEDSRVRLDTNAIDRALGGTFALEIMIHAPEQGIKDPAVLRKLEQLQRWLERQPDVARVISIADSLKELNRVLHDNAAEHFKLPESREVVAQYYLLFEGEEEFRKLVQRNYSLGRMTVRYRQAGAPGQWTRRIEQVDRKLEQLFKRPLQASTTGLVKLTARLDWYFVTSLIKSFLLAFALITVIMAIMLRSARLALFAMIPNLVPIIFGLGFMAAVGISLNPGTLMIASIAIGLVVDDTVHFLFRIKHSMTEGATLEDSIDTSLQEAGRPIVFTSVAVTGGFLVMGLAENVASIHFAIISSLVIVAALLADLVLLPAVLLTVRPRLVRLDRRGADE